MKIVPDRKMQVEKISSEFFPLIEEALEVVPVHNVNFYMQKHSEWPPPFAGLAGYDDDSTYSVTVSSYWLDKYGKCQKFKKYMKWVLKHELRHCSPGNQIGDFDHFGFRDNYSPLIMKINGSELFFRQHDVILYDVGWDKPNEVGFFHEDFEEIKCCDYLMALFQNIEGIELLL